MKSVLRRAAVLAAVMSVAAEIPAGAQAPRAPAAVTLPAAGTFARGGEFTGSVTINRFEQRGDDIVAVGIVRGLLSRGGRTLGSAVAAEVTWEVAVRAGGQMLASDAVRKPGTPMPVAWSPDARSEFGLLRVQGNLPGCRYRTRSRQRRCARRSDRIESDHAQPDGWHRSARRTRVCRIRPARQRRGSGEPLE